MNMWKEFYLRGLYWENLTTQSFYDSFENTESVLSTLQQHFVLVLNGGSSLLL